MRIREALLPSYADPLRNALTAKPIFNSEAGALCGSTVNFIVSACQDEGSCIEVEPRTWGRVRGPKPFGEAGKGARVFLLY